MELRDYQAKALEVIDQELEFYDRLLISSPTGSGKTVTFCEWIKRHTELRILVLVHREELVSQTSKTLTRMGVAHGMITSDGTKNLSERVHVAMVQTFNRRKGKIPIKYDVIIPDEAHLSVANTYKGIFETQAQSKIIGFTATPVRLSKKNKLSDVYQFMYEVTSVRELIERGFLANYAGFVYEQPDMKGVRVKNGEYDSEESGRRGSAIVGDVVGRWCESARDLTTAVFACSILHSKTLVEGFEARGIRAESVDGSTPSGLRRDIFRRMSTGETRVLVNVGIVTEGFDLPALKCVVLCRPTMSLALYLQMVGRALRPFGAQGARIHDHAGCVLKHGLPDAVRDWTLDKGGGAASTEELGLSTCRKCLAIFRAGASCPHGCVKEVGERKGPEIILSGKEIDISELRNSTITTEPVASMPSGSRIIRPFTKIGATVSGTYKGMDEQFVYVDDQKIYLNHSLRGQLKKNKLSPNENIVIRFASERDVGKPKKMRVFEVVRGE